jgi:hypothetical protein
LVQASAGMADAARAAAVARRRTRVMRGLSWVRVHGGRVTIRAVAGR